MNVPVFNVVIVSPFVPLVKLMKKMALLIAESVNDAGITSKFCIMLINKVVVAMIVMYLYVF